MSDSMPFTELLSAIVDNRGKSCPTCEAGIPLIATNCINNDALYPTYDKARYVSQETYNTWFRGHPVPGDLIFVTKGSPGRVCMAPDPVNFCIAQDMVAVRPDPQKIYPKYLFAALRSSQVQQAIDNMHVGTLIPHFKKGDFDKLNIPLPDSCVQKVIGEMYYSLSAKIEQNRRINETLEAMARSIFKSWFVDFDPVRAKASGEPPESICRRLGLSPDVLALFPDSFQDSEFGEIPASWYISTLATEAKRFGGFIQTGPFGSQLHAADYVDEGVPVVMPQDLVNRRISVERIARVTAEMAQRLSRHSVKPGDVVYSRRGDVERHALVSEREAGWLCGTGCLLVRLGDAWPSQAYLSEVLDLPVTREWLVRHAVGATMPNLNTTILGNMPFLIPSESLLHAFESIAGPLRKLQIDKCVESDLLAVTRDTLLPKLLSGELSPNRVSVESLL